MSELAGKYLIVYDLKRDEDDDEMEKQALFFGHDNGVPCVLHDDAKLFKTYVDALKALPLATRARRIDTERLSFPYIVEIPS